jgi:hypothetical protein
MSSEPARTSLLKRTWHRNVVHAREYVARVSDPKAQALFDLVAQGYVGRVAHPCAKR